MSKRLDNAITSVLVIAALTSIALAMLRAVRPARMVTLAPVFERTKVTDWTSLKSSARLIGDSGALVQIVEFGDFECPFCAQFFRVVDSVNRAHPGAVAVWFIHDPLSGHRFARPAARVAECAARQGRFKQMYRALYSEQDSFGLAPWNRYAAAAGVPDLGTFDRCSMDTARVAQIEADVALANRMRVNATPTVIINGWRYSEPPYDSIGGFVDAALKSTGK